MHNPRYIKVLEDHILKSEGSDGQQTLERLKAESPLPAQSQAATSEQVAQLFKLGNEVGLYDAVDLLKFRYEHRS